MHISASSWPLCINVPVNTLTHVFVWTYVFMPGFLASGGEEFNPGPEMWLDCLELLCNKILLKYKGDRESF